MGIVAHAELGGSGTVATDLAMGLAERGHEVHMITPRRPFRLRDECDVRVHELEPSTHEMWDAAPWGLALASHVAEVASRFELEVLHAHFAVPYAASTELACRMLGDRAPLWIVTLHGSDVDPLGRDPAYAPVVRFALSRAHAITVPSRYLRGAATELAAGRPITVIPNFVDPQRFDVDPDRRSPAEREPLVVHASNFRHVKRVQDVVDVFARLATELPARLLLVGDGPELKPALDRLASMGLADRVQAPGAQRDIERWLARAHLALVPSEHESFGLAALEALACGVPVVGSDVGGLPEVVEHGRMGYLLPVGDVDAMAERARGLLTDDGRWEAMASAAREHAQAHFAPSRTLDAYEAVYGAAIDAPTADVGPVEALPPHPLHDA
jgi:N-acetyl-alpha-D-glucosaminyl L-malate synthase BshA